MQIESTFSSAGWDFVGESLNGLFLDWLVRRIGLKELWTLKWEPKYDTAGP
jgi:hypothetical protein